MKKYVRLPFASCNEGKDKIRVLVKPQTSNLKPLDYTLWSSITDRDSKVSWAIIKLKKFEIS